MSPALAGRFSTTAPPGKPHLHSCLSYHPCTLLLLQVLPNFLPDSALFPTVILNKVGRVILFRLIMTLYSKSLSGFSSQIKVLYVYMVFPPLPFLFPSPTMQWFSAWAQKPDFLCSNYGPSLSRCYLIPVFLISSSV